MATKSELDALIAAFNAATNAVAARIERILALISAGGMTADEENAVKAALQAEVDRLHALGQDPATPVPPEPEVQPPPPVG